MSNVRTGKIRKAKIERVRFDPPPKKSLTPEEDQLAILLDSLKMRRDQLNATFMDIIALVNEHSQLQTRWERFLAAGGVDDNDFIETIVKPRLWQRKVVRRKQLRLVRSTPKTKIERVRLQRSMSGPDEAA